MIIRKYLQNTDHKAAIIKALEDALNDTTLQTVEYRFSSKALLDAVDQCKSHVENGYCWVVDLALSGWFSQRNQSWIVQRLSEYLTDGKEISCIHKMIRSGKVWQERFDQTQLTIRSANQLSVVLFEIMHSVLDDELVKRGHQIVRIGSNIMVFSKSRASSEQTVQHIETFINKTMFLNVDKDNTTIKKAWQMNFFGYGFCKGDKVYYRVHEQTMNSAKAYIRKTVSRRNASNYSTVIEKMSSYIFHWRSYLRLANMRRASRMMNKELLRRFRILLWKAWKHVKTKYRKLRKLGVDHKHACNLASDRRGPCYVGTQSLLTTIINTTILTQLIGISFTSRQGTALYRTVCRVV